MFKRKKTSSAVPRCKTYSDDEEAIETPSIPSKKISKVVPIFSFNPSGSSIAKQNDSATRSIDIDGKNDAISSSPKVTNDETYTGLNNYNEYVNKKVTKTTQSNASKLRAGPLKGLTNVRIECRFDYQQGLCKDWKDYGFCGFGDSCIYMHDRSDYKTGWELDKEWEESQKEASVGEVVEEEDLCGICKGEYRKPVVTKCQHVFCEECALLQFSKKDTCHACGSSTDGIFNRK